MKTFNSCIILLYPLFLLCTTNSLEAQDQTYFQLTVQSIAPKEIKFINNSNLEVKVILYNESDKVMTIGIKSLTIKSGKTASYKAGIYNVKIFKPQIFDKHLLTQKNVSGNLQISGTEKKLSAKRLTARMNTEFRNNTGKELKICLYTKGDMLKTIPFATYTLKDNTSTASYNGDERSFFVSVFEPGILDKLLVSQICPDQSIITVNKVN